MPNSNNTAVLAEKIIYNLFRFLWVIVLLPKEGQFAAFAVLVIWWSVKNRQFIRIDRITVWFLAYAGFHLISIIIAVVTRDYSAGRIAAAINTCFIWILAVWIAGIVSQAEKTDINRIGKYCTINLTILFVLFIITVFFTGFHIFNGLEVRTAWTWDLLSSGETTRFIGLFEYPALLSFFVLLQFPFAFKYLSESKYKWSCLGLIPMTLLPVFMTYSRMGILVNAIMVFAAVNYLILRSGVPVRKLLAVYGIMILLFLALVVIRLDDFLELAYRILHVRPGSNSDRMRIYSETIKRLSETSWIIGAGIKEMNSAGVYPLGSHCTYLGIIFKTGILGAVCFAAGLLGITVSFVKETVESKEAFRILITVMLALLMLFCILEDIDGADWLLVMTMMTLVPCITKQKSSGFTIN